MNKMPKIDDIKFSWWKLAVDKDPDPIAFVDIDDTFIFCNRAWCKLVGYSESELKTKKWQDITKMTDIGSDESETNSIKKGDKDEYYIEKKYIKRDGSIIAVKLYVHRYPESGTHEGYVVFARKISSDEYDDLKGKFLDLQKNVLILQQNAVATDFISKHMLIMDQKLEQAREMSKIALEKTSINIGDNLNQSNKAGRDNNSNSNNNSINIFIMILFVIMGVIITYIGMKQ